MSLQTLSVPAATLSMNDFFSENFWRAQFPDLSIGTRLDKLKNMITPVDKQVLARMKERMAVEGYFDGYDDKLTKLMPGLASAMVRLVNLGIPTPFLFLFDEAWECFYRLNPVIANVLGEDYCNLPAFWAWHIDPGKQESGWKPHRDRSRAALAADGTPLAVSVWIPITEANSLNSCMYLLPANRDPVYNTPDEDKWVFPPTDIRAVPGRPGDFFCWNQALLHWGSRSSPFAKHPRISMSVEFQRGDIEPLDNPVLPRLTNMSFQFRLKMIAKQLLQYHHMHPLTPQMEAVAKQMFLLQF